MKTYTKQDIRTVGINQGTKSVEEPSMAVELFLILLLEAKKNLDGTRSLGYLPCFGNDNA